MKYLLDTHVFIWTLNEPDKLSKQIKKVLTNPEHDFFVSIASLWEITIKIRIGKFKGRIEDFEAQLQLPSALQRLDVQPQHFAVLQGLAKVVGHNDPFDHLLVSQAIADKMTIITQDQHIPKYPVKVARP